VLERKKKMDATLHSKKKKALEKKFEAAVSVFPYFRLLIKERRNRREDSNSYKENGLLW
jgi:hypothetical protein